MSAESGMSALTQPAVLDRIPLEIWCQLLENLSYKEVAACRFVCRQWSVAGALTLNKHRGSVSLSHTGNLVRLNDVMSSSTVGELFSDFKVYPRALTTADSELAVSTFLDLMGPTVKSLDFQPLASILQPLYSVNLLKHGRVLLQFLYKSPNLTSLTINFQDRFTLPTNGLESLTFCSRLRHFTAIFFHEFCNKDAHLLLAAILLRSPRLTHLSFDYLFREHRGMKPKTDNRAFVEDVLEMLKELKQTTTIRIKILPQNHYRDWKNVLSLALIEYSKLPHRFASIEVDPPPCREGLEWDDISWDWAQVQSEFLTEFAVQAFPPKNSLTKSFSRLHTFSIRRRTKEIPNMMLATALQTLRVLDVGLITHSSAMFNFVGRLLNLEELTMRFEPHFDCWLAITGEKTRRCRIAYDNVDVAAEQGRVNLLVNLDLDSNCDASASPFLTLKKLKILHLTSSETGLYGILYISMQGCLVRLKQLTLKPLTRPFQFTNLNRETVRKEFQKQLETYHLNVEVNDFRAYHSYY